MHLHGQEPPGPWARPPIHSAESEQIWVYVENQSRLFSLSHFANFGCEQGVCIHTRFGSGTTCVGGGGVVGEFVEFQYLLSLHQLIPKGMQLGSMPALHTHAVAMRVTRSWLTCTKVGAG